MPRFLIERNFAEAVEISKNDADNIRRINDDEGVRWLFSFLSADRRRTYCLYEAPSPAAILEAARRANVPADERSANVVVLFGPRPDLNGWLMVDRGAPPSHVLGHVRHFRQS